MAQDADRLPGLHAYVHDAIRKNLKTVHRMLPAKIIKYYQASQTVDVQPTVQQDLPTSELKNYPIIYKVPVVFPRSEGYFLSFNLQPNDLVALVFSEAGLQLWAETDGLQANTVPWPASYELMDPVAFPGLYPNKRPLIGAATEGIRIGSDLANGYQIDISADRVHIYHEGGTVAQFTFDGTSGNLVVGSGAASVTIAEQLEILYNLLMAWTIAHTHTVTAPGSQSGPPTTAPVFPPWSALIASTKVKIPVD